MVYFIIVRYFRLIRFLLYWLAALAGLSLILPMAYAALIPHVPERVTLLSDGWTVERNEESRSNVRTPDIMQEALNEGEAMLLLHELPQEEVEGACVTLVTEHCALRVYLDDEPVFSYGEASLGRSYPAERHYIPLPQGYGGKTLQLVFTGTKDDAFRKLSEIAIGNRTDLYLRRILQHGYGALYGAHFFLQGLILLGVSVFIAKYLRRNLRILFSALFSAGAGLYAFAASNVFSILWDSAALEARCLAAGAVLMPAGICGIALDFAWRYKKGEVTLTRSATSTTNFSDIPLLAGCCAVIVCALLQIFIRGTLPGGITVLMIGCIVFEGGLLESLYFYAAAHLGETRRHLKLAGIAYTDALTGQSNRTHCEQFLKELDAGHESYFIINFDVNGLKKINDTLGHAEGDRFLKGFAQILAAYFKNADLIGRMGGDEFVVIMKDVDAATGIDKADGLPVLLHKLSRTKSAFKYETSYGCAHSSEVRSRKSNDVYRLADERMYEMKRMVHLRNGGNGRDD